jgi:ABC-2 type transport system permease protein
VVGALIRLKLATLRHSWSGDTSMLWLGALLGLALAAGTWARAAGAENTGRAIELLAIGFALWALIWLVLPIMGGSGGDALRPESFRLLPIPPRRLAAGLLVASAVGVLPLVTVVAFAALVPVAVQLGVAALPVSVAATILSLAFVIALSRVVVGLMGLAMESRIGLELAAIQYALVIALSFVWLPIGIVAARGDGETNTFDFLPSAGDIARVVPTGWGPVAVEWAGSGRWLLVLLALACLTLACALLVIGWAALLARRLHGISGGRGRRFRPASAWHRGGRGVVPATPVGAVVGKELRAWARHPRRTVELRVALWSALFLTVVPGLFGARDLLWPWAGAVIVVIAAVGYSNVYGMDGTSLWLTLLAPGAAAVDVRGRQLAWLLVLAPLSLAVTVILTAASGAGAAWPWVLAVLPALLGSAAGLSPLLALRMPAPLPERRDGDPLELGEDPTTSGTLLVHGLVVFVALPILAAPAALTVWLLPSPAEWLGVPVGLATGWLCASGLGRLAERYLVQSGPELLDELRARPQRADAAPQTGKHRRTERSPVSSAVTSVLLTLGIILLVPQGIVALVFSLVGADVRSWFVALYLPGSLQVVASVVLALVGAALLAATWWLNREELGSWIESRR